MRPLVHLLLIVWVFAALPAIARAVPGPATTAVVANADVPESVALAQRYAAERGVPARQVCLFSLPLETDIDLATYRSSLLEPLEACLADGGVSERIEAVLLIRGVPLRVRIPDGSGGRLVSLAAALGTWRSTEAGAPLLGRAPGATLTCSGGTPCYGARVRNAFRFGPFEPGWSRTSGDVVHAPVLVTMLHGRTYAEAEGLLDSALIADGAAGAPLGQFLLMEGRDAARGALDGEYDGVEGALRERGLTDIGRETFQSDLTGRTLAAFVTGTASLGATIEGNSYVPGSLVDNLTSFGAVPQNFEETGESQVSIARWVARGVAGAHGTTAEPLANSFPSRFFLADYVDGSTLAEAYLRRMPFVYWQNLVLGDPMAAPYAARPEVTVEGVVEGGAVDGATDVVLSATDRLGRGPVSLTFYVDGAEQTAAGDDSVSLCLVLDPGAHELLVVAQAADDVTEARPYRPKGWLTLSVTAAAGATDCATEDAGPADGGPAMDSGEPPALDAAVDAGAPGGSGGCSVVAPQADATTASWLALAVFAALGRRRLGRSRLSYRSRRRG